MRRIRRAVSVLASLAVAVIANAIAPQANAGVLASVRQRGHLVCGVADGAPGLSTVNGHGEWSGLSIDFCRAIAAAVFGSKDAVKFRSVTAAEQFSALTSGDIDVLMRNIGMTSTSDTAQGIRFAGVLLYDGQGFLVRKSQGVASALELSGARICITSESVEEHGAADFFGALRMPYEFVKFEHWPDAVMAYANKSCQVLSADTTLLAYARQQLPDPGAHILLPEIAGKKLIGPIVRQGDEEWFNLVRWTLYALVAAEELGINGANVDSMRVPNNGEARRFLGLDLDLGSRLGVSADWTQRIIRQVGNYGELYDRHFGAKSPLRLERRLNNLWTKGGLQFAPPFR
jgi:general L-amino acid transport system substrate-binding protein